MDTHMLILGASLVIIASYFFSLFSKKTNIPSVLMLMALGYGLSWVVSYGADSLLPYLKVLGTVGVILIVLEAALDLHLERSKWPIIWRALIMAGGLLILTTFIIAGGLAIILSMPSFQALVYALPLSVMSSAIIIPSVQGLNEYKKEFLTFESAFSDILGIVIFYALVGYFETSGEGSLVLNSLGSILITIVLSVLVSYVLIVLFQHVKGHIRLFLLIAILLALYAGGKLLHLSPLILILFFGLTLNNKDFFFRGKLGYLIHDESFDHIVKDFRLITLESAFVVRTFFFVVFGMSIVLGQLLHWTIPLITMVVLMAIYATRYGGLRLFFNNNIFPEFYIAPRGLITVLLFYAIPQTPNGKGELLYADGFESGILLLTILITSFIMSYGLIKNGKPKTTKENAEEPADENPPSTDGLPSTEDLQK